MLCDGPKVLVVDDDAPLLQTMMDILQPVCAEVLGARQVDEAMSVLQREPVDVVVTDLCMPGERGTALLEHAARHGNDPAVVIVSGNPNLNDALKGVQLRAFDFLLKPFSREELRMAVTRASAELSSRRRLISLEDVPGSEHVQLETLVAALDACEHETCSHSMRVRDFCFHLARMAGLPAEQLPQLSHASLLHDIGKIGIPPSILCKPGRLTPDEFEVMKTHVTKGVRILERVPSLRLAIPIVLNHHENYDGTGYPNGIAGEEIPLAARIFSIVDTVDAMTSDRPYRRALSFEQAYAEVKRCAGRQFDPCLADIFLHIPPETWDGIRTRANDAAGSGWQTLCSALRSGPSIPAHSTRDSNDGWQAVM